MKKLLITILSVLMLCTLATTNVFADINTVADVLATVENFPTSTNPEVPENAWVSEDGNKIFASGSNGVLFLVEPGSGEMYSDITQDGSVSSTSDNNYLFDDTTAKAIFNMNSGKLVSITIDITQPEECNRFNGTYYPPVEYDTKDVNVEYEVSSSYEWSVPQTLTISTSDSTIDIKVTSATLAEYEKIKIAVASSNNFNVKNGSTALPYKLAYDSTYSSLIENNEVVLKTTEAKTQTLHAKLDAAGSKVGKYTDTLTFTATVEVTPGLYNGDTFTSWNELTAADTGLIKIENSLISHNNGTEKLAGKLVIDSSVTGFAESAFFGCEGLTSVIIPDSIAIIEEYAFSYCSGLTSVTIPNGVTTIRSSAFEECTNLSSITIPSSVKAIGEDVFNHCTSLSSIVIPNGIKTLTAGLFAGCTNLTSVTIPNSVTEIIAQVFINCENLSSIDFTGTKEEWGEVYIINSAFDNVPTTVVHCTDGDAPLVSE